MTERYVFSSLPFGMLNSQRFIYADSNNTSGKLRKLSRHAAFVRIFAVFKPSSGEFKVVFSA